MAAGPPNQLNVYHAIYGRSSAWKFADRPVDSMAIERMLDAAVWTRPTTA